MPDGKDADEGHPSQRERLEHGQRLRQKQQAMTIKAICDDAGEGSQEEGGNLPAEEDKAEPEGSLRHLEDEPGHGDLLHPGADHRHALAEEIEPVVSVSQGSQEDAGSHGAGVLLP